MRYAKFPNPPAPITPATAVEPINAMAVTVIPDTSAGSDSGISTFVII